MSKQDKEFKLNIEALNFKPIDWSVYQDKVNHVQIHVEENSGVQFDVPSFSVELDDNDILKFNKAQPSEININIDSSDINLNNTNTYNIKAMVEEQCLTNHDSRAFQNRRSHLESKKNWTKISLDDDDSFKL